MNKIISSLSDFFRALLVTLVVVTTVSSCTSEESTHRAEYWTDENYPKYGLLAMTIIPDSSDSAYIATIKELVTVGRETADFVPENSLKYAKEIADQMYLVQTEGLRIYLGEFQAIDKPLCQLDSSEQAIFMHLKYGEFKTPVTQEPDTVIVELVDEP